MYRNPFTTLVLLSKDFHTNLLKKEEKCKFFLADFMSISANYGVLVLILAFKSLYVS